MNLPELTEVLDEIDTVGCNSVSRQLQKMVRKARDAVSSGERSSGSYSRQFEFFERERTDRQVVDRAILLYNFGVSFRKVARFLGRIGVERSDVAVWR